VRKRKQNGFQRERERYSGRKCKQTGCWQRKRERLKGEKERGGRASKQAGRERRKGKSRGRASKRACRGRRKSKREIMQASALADREGEV